MKTLIASMSGRFVTLRRVTWLAVAVVLGASLFPSAAAAAIEPLSVDGNHFKTAAGDPVRFWGVNLVAMYPTHVESDGIAANLASREVNLARLHHNLRSSLDWNTISAIPALVTYVNDTRTPHIEAWDRFDYLNAKLRDRGIYTLLSLHSSRRFLAGDVDILATDGTDRTNWMNAMTALNSMPGNLDLFKMLPMLDERCAKLMEEFAERLVTHVNPYTGIAYGIDPQVLYVEMMNEHSSEYAIVAGNKFQSSSFPAVAYFTTLLQAKWDAYTTANGIAACDIYAPSTNPQKLARGDFLRGLDEAYFNRMKTFVRNLGCQSPLGFSNLWRGEAFQKIEESVSDVVEEHNYADPLVPRAFDDAFNYFTRSTPVGKPYFVGELNQGTTDTTINANSPYRATMQLAASAYGAFNGWSGITWFAWAHGDKMIGNDGWSIWEERRPVVNGDVIGQIESDGMMLDHLRTAGLIFRRGLVAPSAQPKTLYADDPLAVTGYSALVTPKYQFQPGWQNVYAIKRAFGPVPASQPTAPWMTTAPVNPLVSDTGEIRKDTARQQLTVSAPQAEAFSGKLDAQAPGGLTHLGLGATSGSATVILVASDGQALGQSEQLVLSRTYLDASNNEVSSPVTTLSQVKVPASGYAWHLKRTRPRGETGYEALTMQGGVLGLPNDGWHEAELSYAPVDTLPVRQSLQQVGDTLRPIFDDAYRIAGTLGTAQGGFTLNAQGVIDPSTTFTPAEGSKSLRMKFNASAAPVVLGINFTNSAAQATTLDFTGWQATAGLRFWVYTKRNVSSFSVELASTNGGQLVETRLPLANYLQPSDYGNKWVEVTVPFADFPAMGTHYDSATGQSTSMAFTWSQVKGTGFYCSTAVDGFYDPYVDNVRVVLTAGAGPQIPAAPTSPVATAGDTQVVLGWTAVNGADHYSVKRATVNGGPYTAVSSPINNTFTDTAVSNETTYYYVVTAVNAAGESANSSQVSAVPHAQVGVPTGLVAAGGNAQVTLSWAAAPGATSYRVKRATLTGGPYTMMASSTSTGYVDASVVNGTTYYYVVSAVNGGGESANSTQASATPTVAPVPPAPGTVTVTSSNAQISLAWPPSAGATQYKVRRATVSGGPYTLIASPSTNSYVDGTAVNGTTYYYVVSAVNGSGESANSSEVSGTAQSSPSTTVTIISSGAEDGWVQESSPTSNVGGSFNVADATGAALIIGDTNSNRQNKLVVSFDTSAIPADATIVSARLKLKRGALIGTNPFTVLGACYVDLKGGTGFGGATALAAADFQAAPDVAQAATMSNPVNNGDWSMGELNVAGVAGIDRAGKTQLRVYFAAGDNANSSNDYVGFYSGDNSTATNRPVLEVTYATELTITSAETANGTYGAPFRYEIRTPGTATSYTAMGLPPGLAVDAGTGAITGTPSAAGDYVVTIGATSVSGSATKTLAVSVAKALASVVLSDLASAYDGTSRSATATTTPGNIPFTVLYDGSASVPANAGTYAVTVSVTDPNYVGSAAGTFVIAKGVPVITWTAPGVMAYGTALGAGQLNAATNVAGTFLYTPAAGTVLHPGAGQTLLANFVPADSANFETATHATTVSVSKAAATIVLGNLVQAYDGTAKTVGVETLPAGLNVTLTYEASTSSPVYPGEYAVVATIEDIDYQGTETGTLTVGITAAVRHAPLLNGEVDGSVQAMLPESITLNSSALISGDLLLPGTPAVLPNGQPIYGSTVEGTGNAAPANYQVTLNSGSVLRHVVRRIDAPAWPAIVPPPAPAGGRNVTLDNPSQGIGDAATLRNLMLNSNVGPIAVPPGTYGNLVANSGSSLVLGLAGATTPAVYNLQNLSLNGTGSLQLAGPVIVTLASGTIINGVAGDAAHPAWLVLRLSSGGLTLNSGATFHGYVVAPAGTVTINGNSTLHGRVTSDRLVINGGGVLEDLDR